MKKLKKMKNTIVKFWVLKIKLPIKNLWFKYVGKPMLDKKLAKEELKKTEELKKQFSKMYGDYDEIKKLMYTKPHLQTDDTILYQDLINNRKQMIMTNTSHTPFLFEPEIIDIHNENLNPNAPLLEDLIKFDDEKAKSEIKKQELKEYAIKPRIKTVKDDLFNDVSEDEKTEDVSLQKIRAIVGQHENAKFKDFLKNLNDVREIMTRG